jgi:hypothetical protein
MLLPSYAYFGRTYSTVIYGIKIKKFTVGGNDTYWKIILEKVFILQGLMHDTVSGQKLPYCAFSINNSDHFLFFRSGIIPDSAL